MEDLAEAPSPRTAKRAMREVRRLRTRVTELEGALGGPAGRASWSTEGPSSAALSVSQSLPAIIAPASSARVRAPQGAAKAPDRRPKAKQTEDDLARGAPDGARPSMTRRRGGGDHEEETRPWRVREIMFSVGNDGRTPVGEATRPLSETETQFIAKFGISLTEIMQRLVIEEVIHELDARHLHRLITQDDETACNLVVKLELAGGSSSRAAVKDFRRCVIQLFRERLPEHCRPRPGTREALRSRGTGKRAPRGSTPSKAQSRAQTPSRGETTTTVRRAQTPKGGQNPKSQRRPSDIATLPLQLPAIVIPDKATQQQQQQQAPKVRIVEPADLKAAPFVEAPKENSNTAAREEAAAEAVSPKRDRGGSPRKGAMSQSASMRSDVSPMLLLLSNVRSRYKPSAPRGAVPVIAQMVATLEKRVADVATARLLGQRNGEGAAPRGGEVVLVGRGRYNPIHKMHLRHFVIARQYLETKTTFAVLGGLVLPKHATEVRQRCRTRPVTIVPPRHRLGMTRAAVGARAWLTVDPWEVTRRRIQDYLSTLDHVATLFKSKEGLGDTRLVYLVAPDELMTLNLESFQAAGHLALTICRPQQHDRLVNHLGARWQGVAFVVEDAALLSAELDALSSAKVRADLAATGDVTSVESAVPAAVRDYMARHRIAEKMAGHEKWTRWDKDLDDGEGAIDRGYRRQPKKIVKESTIYMNLSTK